MDGLVMIKASDLEAIMTELKAIREEIKQFRESELQLRCYTIQEAADFIGVHYNTVRNLLDDGKLKGNYLHGDHGKCTIPYWSLLAYVEQHKPKDQH